MARLGADQHRIGCIQSYRAFNHLFRARYIRALKIDLVDDRNNLESVVDREVRVGQRLRFHSLRSIHHQQRAFARGERPRNFIGKIHVAGCVDQVQLISLAIQRGVHHPDRVRLDGDAALPLQIHGVQHLRLHLARSQRSGQFQQAVRQRGFAMVDMRDDREVAKEGCVHRLRANL